MGHGGLHCLYYRIPQKEMDGGLVLMMNEGDVTTMLTYAMENDNKIDVYVEHENQESEDENVLGKSGGEGDMNDEGDDSDFAA